MAIAILTHRFLLLVQAVAALSFENLRGHLVAAFSLLSPTSKN